MKQTFREFYNQTVLETPLEDYQTHGNWKKAYGFRDKRDRMLIQHPRAIEMVKKKFGNTEHIFRFYFVNSAESQFHVELGLKKLEWVRMKLGDSVADAVAQHMDDDTVNVIFTNNKGDERRNMSAWIMAHRIGHAMASRRGDGDAFGYKQAHDNLIRGFSGAMEYYTQKEFPSSEKEMTDRGSYYDRKSPQETRMPQLVMLKFFHEVGGFRSAREGNIRDWFEVMNELIAQYLTTGKIKFRPAPARFGSGGTKRFSYSTREVDEVNDHLATLARDMQYYIDNAIGMFANRILVM